MGPSSSSSRNSVLVEESVMVNVATPYQRVSFSLNGSDLGIQWPHAILGVIPVRLDRLDLPLSDLRSIRFTHTVIPSRLALAIGLVSLLVVFDLSRWIASLVLILAIWFLLLSVVGAVEVVHAEGRSTIPVCLLQRQAVKDFVARVWTTAGLEPSGEP